MCVCFPSCHNTKMQSCRKNSVNGMHNIVLLSLLLGAGVLYLIVSSVSSSTNPLLLAYQPKSCTQDHDLDPYIKTFPVDELELALRRASMGNKTVIIVMLNKAYAEPTVKSETTMFDLFLESFWVGEETMPLLDHLLVVAADQTAYDRCMFKRLNCYKMETEGVDFGGEKLYMSKDFINMMWRRTLLLLDILKLGYSFVFTDADVMWLRNPFQRLNKNESIDLEISTDWFNGNASSEKNCINTGFYYVKANNKTIALFDAWYSRKDNSTGKKEQDVLLELIGEGSLELLNIKARFMDTLYFSGFCRDSKDVREVATVHANCCRSIRAKLVDLRSVLRDWMRFKAVTAHAKRPATLPFHWSPHFACWNSWNNTSL